MSKIIIYNDGITAPRANMAANYIKRHGGTYEQKNTFEDLEGINTEVLPLLFFKNEDTGEIYQGLNFTWLRNQIFLTIDKDNEATVASIAPETQETAKSEPDEQKTYKNTKTATQAKKTAKNTLKTATKKKAKNTTMKKGQ